MKYCAIIPVYNEEKRVATVITGLLQAGIDVIAVDDGSTDGSYNVLKRLPIVCTRHEINLGQGAAIRTGTTLAMKLGYDAVVHVDADGQHRIEDAKMLVENLIDHQVCLGSRFMNSQTKFPLAKRIILPIAKMFSHGLLNLKFSDPQSGLRAFRLESFPELDWQYDDFRHCTEIMSNIVNKNLKYKEFPIVVTYDDYSRSKSVRPRVSMGWKLLLNKLID